MYSLALIIFAVSEKKAFEHFPIGSNVNGHLGFLIGIKNRNLVKDILMIILLQFGFSQFINFVEDHPRNIPAKFGSNWPSGFGEEA